MNQRPVVITPAQPDGHVDTVFISGCILLVSLASLRIHELLMLQQQPPKCPLVLPKDPCLLLSLLTLSVTITIGTGEGSSWSRQSQVVCHQFEVTREGIGVWKLIQLDQFRQDNKVLITFAVNISL